MNHSTLKLELLFTDRKQIVEDITRVITEDDLNIISMEVENKDKKTLIYIETKGSRFSPSDRLIIKHLETIPDLIEITPINSMPQQIREKRLELVLDSISDGILSIDKFGFITTINRVAKKMLGWTDITVSGRKLSALPAENHDLLECLKGKSFHNKKRDIITSKGRFQFFSAGVPIKDITGEITGAIEIMRNMKEIKELADQVNNPAQYTFSDIIGKSASIMDAISFAQKIARTSSIASIRGESGTGKELFARAIHTESNVKGEFVAVNCAALPESLLESELFGYEKGAFTGAALAKSGKFEQADNGTLFLDEISNLPIISQSKFLRAIQEKKIQRLGSKKTVNINVRIIVATNSSLQKSVNRGEFREDLFHRLNEFKIELPSLTERKDDIPNLTKYFISEANKEFGKNVRNLSSGAYEILTNYNWPGNIRELKNVIKRAVLLTDSEIIDELPIENVNNNLRFAHLSLQEAKAEAEKNVILRVLHTVKGNKKKLLKFCSSVADNYIENWNCINYK